MYFSKLFSKLILVIFIATNPVPAETIIVDVDIPPQSMNSALKTLAEQADINILYTPGATRDVMSKGVKGRYSARKALDALLADTGLDYKLNGDTASVGKKLAQANHKDENQTEKSTQNQSQQPTDINPGAAEPGANKKIIQKNNIDSSNIDVLEEIIVTAQKREQNLQDIGLTLTAFSGERLQELGFVKSEELAFQTPNLGIRNDLGTSFPIISIRGVSLVDTKANNVSSAAVHIDEVYLGSPALLGLQLFDFERAEILKGPQGTLFGKNTTAGSINFVSRKPTDEFEGFITGQYGRFEEGRVEGAISGPVNEQLKLRLAGVYETGDGYTTNRLTGNDLGGDNRFALRFLADWSPVENFNILLNVHGGQDNSEVGAFQHRALIDLTTGGLCGSAASSDPLSTAGCADFLGYVDSDGDPFEGEFNIESEFDNDALGVNATITWDLDTVTITSLSAYDSFTRNHAEDNDASPNRFVDQNYDEEFYNFSQEFRIASDTDNTLSWILGLYYATEDFDLWRDADLSALLGPGGVLSFEGKEDRTALAAFAHTEWQFAPQFRLTAGLRYSDEEKEYDYINNNNHPYPFFGEISFSNVSGRVGLDYILNDDVLLYFSVSKGFKSGGWPAGVTQRPVNLIPYDEEKVIAYEAGLKSVLLSQRLRLNLAGFYYDYSDLQVFAFIPQTGAPPLQVFTNASNAEILGFEGELQWVPTAGLEIQLGIGLLDTEFKDFNSADGTDLSGERLANAPKTNFNGLIRYEYPVTQGGLIYIQSDFVYESNFSFAIEEQPFVRQEGYWLVNARAGYQTVDKKWDFTVWGKNVFDEEYLASAIDAGLGYVRQAWGKPATYGVSASYRW